MIDWAILFVYILGTILLISVIIMGIMIIQIIRKSSNGKIVKEREIKLASASFAISGSLPIFMVCFGFFYQESFIAVALGLIGSIIIGFILNFVWRKIVEALIANYTTAHNMTHLNDVK